MSTPLSSSSPGGASPKGLSAPKVLVVEDDFFIAQDISNELSRRGLGVIGPLADSRSALALLTRERPDLAILDINLGGQMAYDVADALTSLHIPFIFASGYTRTSLPARYQDVPLVEKPYRSQDLIQHIKSRFAGEGAVEGTAWPRRNALLRSLAPGDIQDLRRHARLVRPGDRPRLPSGTGDVLFPEAGFCTLALGKPPATGPQVAMIGAEGVVAAPLSAAVPSPPWAMAWHAEAEAIAIPMEVVASVAARSPDLQEKFARFHRSLMLQIAWTAQVNATLDLPRRLGRWILMAADRCGDRVRITHAELGRLLGVRRAGVTTSMHVLEGEGWIRSTRGLVVLRKRAGLERFVGPGYCDLKGEMPGLQPEGSCDHGRSGAETPLVS
ncbi:MAG: helix-turn-helix domain-containing protein [Alsobacter sp.]